MSTRKPVVNAHYPTRRVALASCRAVGGNISLFVPSTLAISAGTDVRIQVSFGDAAQTFELEGTVTWRRAQARGLGLEPGLGVQFVPAQRFLAAQMLAFCAGRPLGAGTAAEPRIEAQVACQVLIGKHQLAGQIRDLSATGAFVAGRVFSSLHKGTELSIELSRGWLGFGIKRLKARVVWSGCKKGKHGFGARFVEDASRTRPVLRRYLKAT